MFSSPLFNGSQNYSRIAFEADMPRVELSTNPPCNRSTGANCVNPPAGANFYPFYSTRNAAPTGCLWQEGGDFIQGTTNDFGGSSTTEFGSLLQLSYASKFGVEFLIEDFRQILSANPCAVTGGG
jgi:hypothetical protein